MGFHQFYFEKDSQTGGTYTFVLCFLTHFLSFAFSCLWQLLLQMFLSRIAYKKRKKKRGKKACFPFLFLAFMITYLYDTNFTISQKVCVFISVKKYIHYCIPVEGRNVCVAANGVVCFCCAQLRLRTIL